MYQIRFNKADIVTQESKRKMRILKRLCFGANTTESHPIQISSPANQTSKHRSLGFHEELVLGAGINCFFARFDRNVLVGRHHQAAVDVAEITRA